MSYDLIMVAIGMAIGSTGVYLAVSTRPSSLVIGGIVAGSSLFGYTSSQTQAAKIECGEVLPQGNLINPDNLTAIGTLLRLHY